MKDLLLSEWRRFRTPALIAALAHGLLLLFLSRVTNLFQLPYGDHAAMLLAYLLLGMALAFVQVGSYRKPSQWLWLMHRPLSPRRIFFALMSSALLILALVVLLPLLLFVLATDLFTTQVVDSRHYVVLLYTLAFAAMAWLAAAHAVVSRSKAAVAVLVAPLLLALHLASVWWLLPIALACLLWLTTIALHGFRADREAPVQRHGVLLLTALPLALGFFLLLFHLSKAAIEVVAMMTASRHSTTLLASDADSAQFQRSFGQSFMIKGLADSLDPRAPSWREQLPLLEVRDVIPDVTRFPVRHQISNLGAVWWDEKRRIEWNFSHDQMMYFGRDPDSGAARGVWGANGVEQPVPFSELPIFNMSRNALYAVDDEDQRQSVLVQLPDDEVFIGRPTRAFDRTLLLTTKRLLAYRDDRTSNAAIAPLLLDWEIALPASDTPIAGVAVAELMDGWLVSLFHFPGREFDGFLQLTDPWQQIVFVDSEGKASAVGERHRIGDHSATIGGPPLVPASSWWASPLLYAIAKAPDALLDKGLTQARRFEWRAPAAQFYPLAAVLMLLSVVLAYGWLRRTNASAARRRIWLVSCFALGLPAFCALLCLEPRAAQR